MRNAGLGDAEARIEIEDRLAALMRDHAPRREALAVANAIHTEADWRAVLPRPQEVRVQRVQRALVRHRRARGQRGLRGHQPTEQPPLTARRLREIQIAIERFERE